jgi:hypothetical protein
MNGFIKLHERKGNAVVLINPEYIVSVKDMRTDKAVKNLKDWQWSILTTTKNSYDVEETESEIIEMLEKALNL